MARYNGDGSWHELLLENYEKSIIGTINNTKEADSGIKTFPLSFFRTGSYTQNTGSLSDRKTAGFYWASYNIGSNRSAFLLFYSTRLVLQNNDNKGYGFSACCGDKIGDATDSICPKGWEMARDNGDRSYRVLLVDVYRKSITGNINNIEEADSGIKLIPLSLFRAGYYIYSNGVRYYRGLYGYYWESRIFNTSARYLRFYSSYFHPQHSDIRGYGFSVRCGAKS